MFIYSKFASLIYTFPKQYVNIFISKYIKQRK